jgi:hypothetical protein
MEAIGVIRSVGILRRSFFLVCGRNVSATRNQNTEFEQCHFAEYYDR